MPFAHAVRNKVLTVRECKEWLIGELQSITDVATFEANELLYAATNTERGALLYRQNVRLTDGEMRRLKRLLYRRKTGQPLQYLLGEWEFYSLPFMVGRGVLIPRADSELLVDLALEEIPTESTARLYDLCAGSGALGIAIAHHRPELSVTAVEKSRKAYGYLQKNIKRNRVSVRAIRADLFRWRPEVRAEYLICNPPYITAEEMQQLEKEVTREPTMALFGGKDGLTFYRFFSTEIDRFLKPGGRLWVEIGWKQGEAVSALFASAGFTGVEVLHDLAGNDRVVTAVRPE